MIGRLSAVLASLIWTMVTFPIEEPRHSASALCNETLVEAKLRASVVETCVTSKLMARTGMAGKAEADVVGVALKLGVVEGDVDGV
jgi:hypothetical protein